ncbi:hypothetical protein LWI28_023113 [Acer negundo]|uniref:Integrase catalytic domain-containing protein n=1 Tax=Acer negundo TaxID=4023 RepID=A0AAD5JJX2_ACENE|nr:hypothetical protein LWI28_023113 [Acer negundo]
MGTKVGEVRGDQQAARNCYAVSTNPVAFARQGALVASEVNPDTPEQRHYDMEEGDVPDIVIEEQDDEDRDYTNLNRACLKDSFLLPKIDQLIDSITGNKLLSFMDAFSGYNQIMMHPSDQDKTSFITGQGLYCYKVIRKNQMRLKPVKYVFGVAVVKFLGFMIHEREIESNPEKIKAILDLKSHITLKQAQGLTGRIAALNRFISRSTDKCLPFFKIIKKEKKLKWDEQNELAFQALKEYLASPPLLVKPYTGEELQLYLAISKAATSGALVKECSDGIQRPVYYVSRAFTKSEKKLYPLEKAHLCLSNYSQKAPALFSGIHYRGSYRLALTKIAPEDGYLVVNQVLGLYQAKGDNMVAYLAKVREAMSGFKGVRMEQIPREKNHRADVLAKIAVDPDQARKLKRIATRYCLVDGYLYRKGKSLLLLRCLHPDDATWALNEVHSRDFDLIGPLPTAPGQAKHAVVAIDYFIRWVEAKALVKITEEKTTIFVKENIVCRFGIPIAIITDLEKQFDNAKFKEFYEDRNIDLQFASVDRLSEESGYLFGIPFRDTRFFTSACLQEEIALGTPTALAGVYPPPGCLVLKCPKLPTTTDHQKDRDTFTRYPIPYFSISL